MVAPMTTATELPSRSSPIIEAAAISYRSKEPYDEEDDEEGS